MATPLLDDATYYRDKNAGSGVAPAINVLTDMVPGNFVAPTAVTITAGSAHRDQLGDLGRPDHPCRRVGRGQHLHPHHPRDLFLRLAERRGRRHLHDHRAGHERATTWTRPRVTTPNSEDEGVALAAHPWRPGGDRQLRRPCNTSPPVSFTDPWW